MHLIEFCMNKQDGKCAICQKDLMELPRIMVHLDRIIPARQDGKYTEDNTRALCVECDWEREDNKPNSPHPMLASAYRAYKNWQTESGRFHRKVMFATGDAKGTTKSPYTDATSISNWLDMEMHCWEQQKYYEKLIGELLKDIPAAQMICDAWGGGPILAAMIVSKIDIRRAETPSALWKFFGYAPYEVTKDCTDCGFVFSDYEEEKCPECDTKRKGWKKNPGKGKDYKSQFFASLEKPITRKSGPFRPIYENLRVKYEGVKAAHFIAISRIIKIWISQLWTKWRELEGLSTVRPYAQNHLAHDGYYAPEDYGW
jgi:hypothetical protein